MFEKVSPQHPDKMCDRLAGAIVDVAYSRVENPKVACEVLIGHGECTLQIETSERLTAEELEAIVHRIAGEDIVVRALIVPQDVHLADNQKGGVKCGDRSANVVRRLLPKGRKNGIIAPQGRMAA